MAHRDSIARDCVLAGVLMRRHAEVLLMNQERSMGTTWCLDSEVAWMMAAEKWVRCKECVSQEYADIKLKFVQKEILAQEDLLSIFSCLSIHHHRRMTH